MFRPYILFALALSVVFGLSSAIDLPKPTSEKPIETLVGRVYSETNKLTKLEKNDSTISGGLGRVAESVVAFRNMMRQVKPDSCYVCTSPCNRYYCCDGEQCTYYNGNCYCVR